MEPADALEILGLAGPAGPHEVKQAYRRLARELHPDAGGDAERFRNVQLAFEAIRGGTDARTSGPRAQVHVAGVEERWWETPGAWHGEQVDVTGVDLDRRVERARTPADLDLVASLLLADPEDPAPVRPLTLHSRAPGAMLNRLAGMLDPDLLARITIRPAPDGPRAGHDVRVEVMSSGGRGRRALADVAVPTRWTRHRGTEAVRLVRDLRPSRRPEQTAVRVARAVDEVTRRLAWPLPQWSVLRASS